MPNTIPHALAGYLAFALILGGYCWYLLRRKV